MSHAGQTLVGCDGCERGFSIRHLFTPVPLDDSPIPDLLLCEECLDVWTENERQRVGMIDEGGA